MKLLNIFGMSPKILPYRVMYIAPSSGLNMPFKLILRRFEPLRLFSNVWSKNDALFERLMEIHSNPPILYYGFNVLIISYNHCLINSYFLLPCEHCSVNVLFNNLVYMYI